MKEADIPDFFTLSQNVETCSCDFCNKAFETDFEKLTDHLLEKHQNKFSQIKLRISCRHCKDTYDLDVSDPYVDEECANCEKCDWSKEYLFFVPCEYLGEWYKEKIINITTGRQNSGMTRFLEVENRRKTLFKLYHKIDYSYLGQSRCVLEYWNGNNFTNVTHVEIRDYVNDGHFNVKAFEKMIHEIIEIFLGYI